MKSLMCLLVITTSVSCFSQKRSDSTYLSEIYLDEVVVLGEKKIKATKLGYLNKENFTLSLYKDYEIGVFIPNEEEFENIEDLYLKINNELLSVCKIQLNFYKFDRQPTELIASLDAIINPSNKKKQVISTENLKISFPEEGIFISTKILSDLRKQDESHLRIYLTEKYDAQATFIRGSIYGNNWNPLSKLNIGRSQSVNACYGFFASKQDN